MHWLTRHADLLQIIDPHGRTVEVDALAGEGVVPIVVEVTGSLRAVAYNAAGRDELLSEAIVAFEPARVVDVPLPSLGSQPEWLGPLPRPLRLRAVTSRSVPGVARWSEIAERQLARFADAPAAAFHPVADTGMPRQWPTWPGAPGPWVWMTLDEARADTSLREVVGIRRWWRRRMRRERT